MLTGKNKQIGQLMLVLLFAVAGSTYGDMPWYISEVEIYPPVPTTSDTVSITLSGMWQSHFVLTIGHRVFHSPLFYMLLGAILTCLILFRMNKQAHRTLHHLLTTWPILSRIYHYVHHIQYHSYKVVM